MSENKKYFGVWCKTMMYGKIEIEGKNYHLNIIPAYKSKEKSPDYRINIYGIDNTFGAWIKEKEGEKRIYSKIHLEGKNYHLNMFRNSYKEKGDNKPEFNITVNEVGKND